MLRTKAVSLLAKGVKVVLVLYDRSGETDSGYYTIAEARGYTMYEFIIWVSYLAIKAHT